MTRREFHAAGSLVLGGAAIVSLETIGRGAEESAGSRGACNFNASFMTWDFPYRPDPRPYARHNTPHGNMARIQLDAIIDVVDRESGQTERFVLICPCRTEWVYAEDRLFQLPSREYRNIYSLTQQRSMLRDITHQGEITRGSPVSNDFRSLTIDVRPYRRAPLLKTSAEIVAATAKGTPLVARTRIDDPKRPLSYVLEYPIKTMNFQPKTNSFQVDTGPLLVPDFQSEEENAIDCLEMAHVAYNRLDRAEFILRRPAPVQNERGETLCHVLHYAEVREDKAVNEFFAGEEEA
jgi:hypothetical protein